MHLRVDPPPAYVRAVFTMPAIWDAISDDSSGSPDEFEPVESPLVRYLAPMSGDEPAGCLMLAQQNAVTLELHTVLLPKYRGEFTKQVFDELLAFIREHYPTCRRLRTWVPSCNRLALKAARRVGFVEVGVETAAYQKNGEIFDNHLFGVTL